jgi:hypothetical protein
MRPRLVIVLAALAAVAVVLLAVGGVRQLPGELGMSRDPPFAIQPSGGLWDARTLRDADGAPDVAYLTADAPLIARVQAQDAPGVQRVIVRIDGQPQATWRARCSSGRCPATVVARFHPLVVRRGTGAHSVEVRAAGSDAAPAVIIARFEVRVGSPHAAAVEVEPRAVSSRTVVTPDHSSPRVDRAIRSVARRGRLARVLGGSRLVVRERGRGAGVVTVLADVRPARRDVGAVLAQPGDDGPVRMQARVLRDVLVDVDVRRKVAAAIQPGPASSIAVWAPVGSGRVARTVSEDEAPSAAFSAARRPRLLRLSDAGFAFFTQDGDASLRPSGRDWPVSVVFAGAASIAKVKTALRGLGLTRRGHARSLGYRLPGSGLLRFDSDRGLKERCDANATDLHVRVYAPTATDRFIDREFGHVVLATVHLDHTDGCGIGPSLFGFSERAERQLAALISTRLHWKVSLDALPLANAEPLRRDSADPTHVWLADGSATVITVP